MKLFSKAAATALFAVVGSVAAQQDDTSFSLKILHMNDHHSHLDEESFSIATATLPSELTETINTTVIEEIDVTYGGLPRLVTLFADLEEAATVPTLKVHAGDVFAGTLFFTLFDGMADAQVMAPICFDVMTLGNHEFDLGNAALEDFLVSLEEETSSACNDVSTRVLSANLQMPQGSVMESQVLPYTIQDYDGDGNQVAVIGLTTSLTALTSSPDAGTTFMGEVEALELTVAAIQGMDINKIVVVSHVGYDVDVASIAAVDGVDVVIGGHSHTLLGQETTEVLGGTVGGAFPTMVDENNVCVVTAWEYAHGLGELDVEFDVDGNVISCEGSMRIPVDVSSFEPADALDETFTTAFADYLLDTFDILVAIEPDEDSQALVDQFQAEIVAFGEEVIATVPQDICYERVPGQGRSSICTPEETLAQGGGACNLVAKAFLDQAPSADVAIQNGGGCRVDIAAGDYTVNDAFMLLPFQNTLVTLEMTGTEIIQVLNEAAILALSGASTGAYPYASGLRFEVDGTNMDMPISNVQVNVRLEGEWTAIEEDTVYTVVTNSFIASGGDGYATFAAIEEVTDLFLEYGNTFVRYSQEVGTLVDPPLSEYSTQTFVPVVAVDGTAAPTAPAEDEEMSSPTTSPMEDMETDPPSGEIDEPIVESTNGGGSSAYSVHSGNSFALSLLLAVVGWYWA